MTRFHALTVADIRRETRDSVSIRFAVPEALRPAFAFAAGQYLTLRATIGGEEIRRSYSICSGPDDGDLRIGVKKVRGGAFSCFANENLKPGDMLEVMPPEGRFTPSQATASRHILGVAAGSGITPILSIIRSVLAREPDSRVTLIYSPARRRTWRCCRGGSRATSCTNWRVSLTFLVWTRRSSAGRKP
jgi:ring-1,2-phenylacetyl-CoA epoxidase subunit PaaE